MRISTFGYVGKQGVKNIWRNKMFSLASIATMSACIFLFGLFFSILVNFQYLSKVQKKVLQSPSSLMMTQQRNRRKRLANSLSPVMMFQK